MTLSSSRREEYVLTMPTFSGSEDLSELGHAELFGEYIDYRYKNPADDVMTDLITAAKKSKGMTWQAIADKMDMGVVWVTSACLGMNKIECFKYRRQYDYPGRHGNHQFGETHAASAASLPRLLA